MPPLRTTITLSLAFLLPLVGLRAQSEAVAAFDSGYVETGNPFRLHLSVPEQLGKPAEVDFSAWETLLPSENRLDQSGWQQRQGRWENTYTLIAFDSAQLELPPLRLHFPGREPLETNALRLSVLPTPAPDDPALMLDIKDIHREPWHWRDIIPRYWPIAAGILLLALAIWWLLLRKRKTGLEAERRIQQPPHELALRKLAELERRQLWQQGQIKTYYSELTHIAREYLERRYQAPALESPTDAILAALEKTAFPPDLLPPLAALLQQADLVKFAKGTPAEPYHAQALGEVRALVEKTRPVLVDPAGPE